MNLGRLGTTNEEKLTSWLKTKLRTRLANGKDLELGKKMTAAMAEAESTIRVTSKRERTTLCGFRIASPKPVPRVPR